MPEHDDTRTHPENPIDAIKGKVLWPFHGESTRVETTSWNISQCARLFDEQVENEPAATDLPPNWRGHIARTHYLVDRLVDHAKELETQLYGEPRKEVWL